MRNIIGGTIMGLTVKHCIVKRIESLMHLVIFIGGQMRDKVREETLRRDWKELYLQARSLSNENKHEMEPAFNKFVERILEEVSEGEFLQTIKGRVESLKDEKIICELIKYDLDADKFPEEIRKAFI
jgi:hypothetical protein